MIMTLLSTSQLRETLASSRSTIDRWVDSEKQKIDFLAERQREEKSKHQRRIDDAVAQLLALQLEGGLAIGSGGGGGGDDDAREVGKNERTSDSDKQREEILRDEQKVKDEIKKLQKELEEKQSIVQELGLDATHEKENAKSAMEWKESVEESKAAAIRDLKRGVSLYRDQLGLEFRSGAADGNGTAKGVERPVDDILRFTFTQLDPSDPSRAFSFCLRCDDDGDSYVMPFLDGEKEADGNEEMVDNDSSDVEGSNDDCSNRIPREVLEELMRELNHTEDLSNFVRSIRLAFVDSL